LNKLVSVQLAVQTRTLIKVPLYSLQDIGYIHPLTSEISTFHKPPVKEWDDWEEGEAPDIVRLNM
jgi:hypothetical protein